jgi:rod shape-determining protein MreC
MGQLLAFLYKFRAYFTFLVLEVLCIWLIVSNNNYQKTVFINTASGVVGSITESSDDITDYFELRRVNEELAEENKRLRTLLLNSRTTEALDSLMTFDIDPDTTDSIQYFLNTAEVIDNSIANTQNMFLINKGSNDGIMPDMGVINSRGVVGKIRSVSASYASAVSLLNIRNAVSATHKKSNRFGTIQWDGVNPRKTKMLNIPKDVNIEPGDTIVTSAFNAVFPRDILIGVVSDVKPDPNQRDWDIEVVLTVDFGALEHVYIIENRFRQEKDSLIQSDPLNQQ